MVRHEIQVKIRGEDWTIRFVTRRQIESDRWGDCDLELKLIRVRRDVSAKNMLDVLIHEIRHAQHPVLFEAEEFITSTSTEMAEILMATGRVHVISDLTKGRKPKP